MKLPLTLLLLICGLNHPTQADTDEQTPSTPENQAVTINSAAQQLSGITTLTLKATQHQQEVNGYGKAISLQPLLNLRNRYRSALAAANFANAHLKQAEQFLNRQQELYKNGISAQRQLQDQQLQWQNAHAESITASQQMQAIKEEALIGWGKVLTEWALADTSAHLDDFITGKRSLLQISLPANTLLNNDPTTIAIGVTGERNQAQTATLIAKAPQSLGNEQGNNYFYQTNGDNIRIGMKISAWLPTAQYQTGVVIPQSSLVWSQSQALVYIKNDQQQFSPRPINQYTASKDGYFVSDNLAADEEIVVTGAQMLLSAQQKQAPTGDDD
ncbi:hypothetical protein JCM14076_11330 [Methylosoma difficile]